MRLENAKAIVLKQPESGYSALTVVGVKGTFDGEPWGWKGEGKTIEEAIVDLVRNTLKQGATA